MIHIPWFYDQGGGWRLGIWPCQNFARTWTPGAFLPRALFWPVFIKTEYLIEGVFAVTSLALYASAPNHVFGQMLGLPGSWVCRLMFHYYRLRRPKENYCDCALVIPDEHLSRESQKLTVMIQRETVQPLEDSPESLGFLCINKGPFPVMYTRARIRMHVDVPGAT